MDRAIARRMFVATTTAGLLATRPSFSSPQSQASTEVFHVKLRQAPPYESLRELISPHADVFQCEIRAVELLNALNELVGGGIVPLAEGFQGVSPLPAGWEPLAEDAHVAQFDEKAPEFSTGLAAWLASRHVNLPGVEPRQ